MKQIKVYKKITPHDNQILEIYFKEISRIELITFEEEVKLSKLIMGGDESATDSLVNSNLRFVVSVAKQYLNMGLHLNDLINEGNYGLVKAAKKFDSSYGFKFVSYAVWLIRMSIVGALNEVFFHIRIPVNIIYKFRKIEKVYNKLEQKLEREPMHSEIANELEIQTYIVTELYELFASPLSFDEPLPRYPNHTLLDIIEDTNSPQPDQNITFESLRTEIMRSLSTLTSRESEIITHFFGIGCEPLELEEIGEKFNLTRERVRQIKEKAVRRLRHKSRCRNLQPYLCQ